MLYIQLKSDLIKFKLNLRWSFNLKIAEGT